MYKKAIFHVHTCYSFDAFTKIPFLINSCLKNGIDVLSVSDHNNMDSYVLLKDYAAIHHPKLKIIPSEEITTKNGSLIGMFLKEPIISGLCIKETISAIKSQGGVVYLPRPLRLFNSLKEGDIRSFIEDVDIMEGFNTRNLYGNIKATWYAREINKLILWGSDSHFSFEIMNCIVSIPDFEMNRESFLEAVKKASLLFKKVSYRGAINTILLKRRLIKNNHRKRY